MGVNLLLSDKQKTLLASIVPGIKSGEVAGDWYVSYAVGGFDISGLGNDPNLNELWQEAEEADFEVFVRLGFFMRFRQTQEFVLRFGLHKGAILDGYKRGWKVNEKDNVQVSISGGDFRGAIVNAASTLNNVQQSIGSASGLSDDAKAQLAQLVSELKEVLSKIPEEESEEAEVLAHHAQVAVNQLNTPKPNKKLLSISVDGLEQAAKNLERVAVPVAAIAVKIAMILRPLTM